MFGSLWQHWNSFPSFIKNYFDFLYYIYFHSEYALCILLWGKYKKYCASFFMNLEKGNFNAATLAVDNVVGAATCARTPAKVGCLE